MAQSIACSLGDREGGFDWPADSRRCSTHRPPSNLGAGPTKTPTCKPFSIAGLLRFTARARIVLGPQRRTYAQLRERDWSSQAPEHNRLTHPLGGNSSGETVRLDSRCWPSTAAHRNGRPPESTPKLHLCSSKGSACPPIETCVCSPTRSLFKGLHLRVAVAPD